MLFGIQRELDQRAVRAQEEVLPWAREMALIEAFALHSRAMIEFLWRRRLADGGPRPSDVLAEDFFDIGAWDAQCPQRQTVLADVSKRVGREVVHLTYHRQQLTAEARAWPFGEIAGSIGRCVRVFIQSVGRDHVAKDFKVLAFDALPTYLQGPAVIGFPPTYLASSIGTRMAGES